MGLSRHVPPSGDIRWDAVAAALRAAGETPVVRMIDGLPAFPDEVPEPGWTELRVSLTAGLVTLRRDADGVTVTVWGNADAALLAARDRLAEALTGLPPT